jgi:hypothetical protein
MAGLTSQTEGTLLDLMSLGFAVGSQTSNSDTSRSGAIGPSFRPYCQKKSNGVKLHEKILIEPRYSLIIL